MVHFIPCKKTTDVVNVALLYFREPLLWRSVNTQLDFSSAYHPQTDGQTEVVNRSLGFSPFQVVYGLVPHGPLDLVPVSTSVKMHGKAKGFIQQLQQAMLTKDRVPAHKYNKLTAKKIGPLEVIEKINPNAYRLKLPSHILTSDVFNIKHLVPFRGDNSDDDEAPFLSNLRENFSHLGENDEMYKGFEFMIPLVLNMKRKQKELKIFFVAPLMGSKLYVDSRNFLPLKFHYLMFSLYMTLLLMHKKLTEKET
ncbi:uncharacterized protein LOC111400135 [Olea europaea var. sylvestris]|uniref:uncharacterized protein LOC111400135 n=1 Tax=Olea europaea var. sylvestris TaxID=158386 RepID=UPI000C1D83C9|nr:uncharacterized protein LOC111400135 [Olea europaea var. sylvestris]